ncbi:hypothetical protein RFI_05824 [Reticulomyxa filosa]|uniref:Uncharacterized protein n=1 Tax=Reticulomyxa filosa TaxID=46433 RepID=X6NZA5_RETFI|nr:hypothetical protein RFI_05824 [Reticulomyxa filosa]|eukprot:ETO31296.1 hypothetical protein RFI_05824 [Reticulomyxa filosa]
MLCHRVKHEIEVISLRVTFFFFVTPKLSSHKIFFVNNTCSNNEDAFVSFAKNLSGTLRWVFKPTDPLRADCINYLYVHIMVQLLHHAKLLGFNSIVITLVEITEYLCICLQWNVIALRFLSEKINKELAHMIMSNIMTKSLTKIDVVDLFNEPSNSYYHKKKQTNKQINKNGGIYFTRHNIQSFLHTIILAHAFATANANNITNNFIQILWEWKKYQQITQIDTTTKTLILHTVRTNCSSFNFWIVSSISDFLCASSIDIKEKDNFTQQVKHKCISFGQSLFTTSLQESTYTESNKIQELMSKEYSVTAPLKWRALVISVLQRFVNAVKDSQRYISCHPERWQQFTIITFNGVSEHLTVSKIRPQLIPESRDIKGDAYKINKFYYFFVIINILMFTHAKKKKNMLIIFMPKGNQKRIKKKVLFVDGVCPLSFVKNYIRSDSNAYSPSLIHDLKSHGSNKLKTSNVEQQKEIRECTKDSLPILIHSDSSDLKSNCKPFSKKTKRQFFMLQKYLSNKDIMNCLLPQLTKGELVKLMYYKNRFLKTKAINCQKNRFVRYSKKNFTDSLVHVYCAQTQRCLL